MNFSSESMFRAVSRDLKYKLPSEKALPAVQSKFDALLYTISKSYLDVAVQSARASGYKTVQKQHVRLIEDMASALRSRGSRRTRASSIMLKGGAETVLPAEYFGKDSGSYFPQEAIGSAEHSAFGDGVARMALPLSQQFGQLGLTGGGKKGCPCIVGGGAKRRMGGGAETVLPSEYFGKNSGAYLPNVSSMEHSAVGSADLARPALPASFVGGGGASLRKASARMPEDVFSAILREYKHRNVSASDIRFSEDAKKLLRAYVTESVSDALMSVDAGGRGSAVLTVGRLQKASGKYCLFPSAK